MWAGSRVGSNWRAGSRVEPEISGRASVLWVAGGCSGLGGIRSGEYQPRRCSVTQEHGTAFTSARDAMKLALRTPLRSAFCFASATAAAFSSTPITRRTADAIESPIVPEHRRPLHFDFG